MNQLLRLFIATLFLISLLSGCSTTYPAPDYFTFDKTDTTKGVMLYSFSSAKSSNAHYYIDIFHIENKTKHRIQMINSLGHDFKNDSMKIQYYTTVLLKGNYKIYGWGMVYNTGNGKTTYYPKGNFSIPFTVFGGDINYVGDYRGQLVGNARNTDGIDVPTGAYFVVSNRYNQDYNVISNKFPNLKLDKVLNSMPDFTANNSVYSRMFLKGINIP